MKSFALRCDIAKIVVLFSVIIVDKNRKHEFQEIERKFKDCQKIYLQIDKSIKLHKKELSVFKNEI